MFMPVNLAIADLCEQNKIMRVKSFGAGNVEVNPENPFMFFSCAGVSLRWNPSTTMLSPSIRT